MQQEYKAFDASKCQCCNSGRRMHPKWGKFCRKEHEKQQMECKLEDDEEKVKLRDGTFVSVYHVKKEWMEEQLKNNNNDMNVFKLLLYCIMDVSYYIKAKPKIANAAMNDFARQNVK